MKTTATNRKLRELLTGIRNGTLIPRPEFQRRLVWTNEDKIGFIKTVLEDYPFPEIYIAAGSVEPDTAEAVEYLVDGQQRITTLYQYFTGSKDVNLRKEIPAFSELNDETKKKFLQYDVVVRDLGEVPLEEVLEVFTRINSTSYSLYAMEIHNARYDGDLKKFGEKISSHEFFESHRIFTATDVKRMNDLRYVLTVIITLISTYFNRDDELEVYLGKYNDEFPLKDELEAQFLDVSGFIEACNFAEKSRCWKKADFFTLLVEMHRAMFKENLPLGPDVVGKFLSEFYLKVENLDPNNPSEQSVYDYYKAALQATNDRGSRIKRGEIIAEIIKKAAKHN